MKKKDLKNVLLVSDIDATLMTSGYAIPQRNIEAIEKFMANDGRFAIATGRSPGSAMSNIFSQVKTNAPSIMLNGGLLWDANTDEVSHAINLDDSVRPLLEEIMNNFPTIGIDIFGCKDLYILAETEMTKAHCERSKIVPKKIQLDNIPKEKFKALFLGKEDEIDDLISFLKEKQLTKFRFFKSSATYLELVPTGVDKGKALLKLCEKLGIPHENCYAIGDYYNDYELLQTAGFSAAPSNAIDDIKNIVDLTVCSCTEGAVAEFIEWIIAHNND